MATEKLFRYSRLMSRFTTIEPNEAPAAIAAFGLFFFMWAGYFSARPVRETIGTLLGRDAVADLWLYTGIFSILLVPLYGAIVCRFRRSTFLPWTYGAVAGALALVGVLFDPQNFSLLLGKSFYVFISVANLFLISMFWSFLLEIFDKGQTKRLFGVIAAGGSAGALCGPLAADFTVTFIGERGVLFISAGLFVVAIACQCVLLNLWSRRPASAGETTNEDRPIGGNWLAGIALIARSRYLLGIALFIVGISAVNTILYFEQLRMVTETFVDMNERTRAFARIDWIVQTITVLSQIFLTGQIAKHFGITVLLIVVPIAMIFGFLALVGSTSFVLFAAVLILRRAGEYSFVRPGREMLWSPFDNETKYKAKNTIDVPVYRVADYLGGQATVALGALGVTAAGMMVVGAAIAAAWGAVGWWLGRKLEGSSSSERQSPRIGEARNA
jgi:AAA family ATP:ADP antiporter